MTRTDKAMLGSSNYERTPGDYYNTESWVTKALLDRVRFRGIVWEPAVGRGDMSDVLVQQGYSVMTSDIVGTTLGCKSAAECDFLTATSPGDATFSIVTNPPYVHAEAFIVQAIKLTARSSGMVAMLLRNEYDCASSRRYLFEQEAFAMKLILTKRPRWAESNIASPRHNFSWFLWDHNHSGSATMKWLP